MGRETSGEMTEERGVLKEVEEKGEVSSCTCQSQEQLEQQDLMKPHWSGAVAGRSALLAGLILSPLSLSLVFRRRRSRDVLLMVVAIVKSLDVWFCCFGDDG